MFEKIRQFYKWLNELWLHRHRFGPTLYAKRNEKHSVCVYIFNLKLNVCILCWHYFVIMQDLLRSSFSLNSKSTIVITSRWHHEWNFHSDRIHFKQKLYMYIDKFVTNCCYCDSCVSIPLLTCIVSMKFSLFF